MGEERLQKLMAQAGYGSRRSCEQIIEQGRVTVNGKRATLGMKADPHIDDVRVDGARLRQPEEFMYFMLYKPRGVISDEDVAEKHQTARELIPLPGRIYPVGRLDLMSEGLMLFTNDGDLAHRLTHPRYDHPKVYQVWVQGHPDAAAVEAWSHGVVIEGERTRPAQVRILRRMKDETLLEFTLREGRKRQIRRMVASQGLYVNRLVRVMLGPLELGGLEPGAWRALTTDEVRALKRSVKDTPGSRTRRSAGRSPRASGGHAAGTTHQGKPSERRKATDRSGSDSAGKGARAKSRKRPRDGQTPRM